MSALLATDEIVQIHAGSRQPGELSDPRVRPFAFDLTKEASLIGAAAQLADDGPLDLVFVATGVLHGGADWGPEKSLRGIDADHMADVFAINTIGPAIVAKNVLPLLPRQNRSVFAVLSARVGSINDNRLGGWHSYRASKAALNMLIRTLAIEMAVRAPESVVLALHPGTVDSPLSQPFQRAVAPGKLFTPAQSANHLLTVIDNMTPADSGGLFAWNGERIPA